MRYSNILNTIWNTPFIKLEKILKNKNVKLYAKLEWQNPGWSIKDRIALYMIKKAETKWNLKKWQTILEATSWNMWISLAMIWAYLWYKVNIVMSEGMSLERKTMLRSLWAELILTDKKLGTEWAIQKARKLIKDNPKKYWFANQFNNPDNVEAHYNWIAKEIITDLPNIDYFISWIWTSWTIMWIAKKLKETNNNTQIVWVIPPAWYWIQWIQNPTDDFSWNILKNELIDKTYNISNDEAYAMSRLLAITEWIFAWMSSWASLFIANEISKKIKSGTIVIIIPDRWEKYLSTELFS